MPDIRDYVATKVRPYWYFLLGGVIFVVFIALAIYMYLNYGSSLMKKKKFDDVANESTSNIQVDVMLFTVDWCPHCKKAGPEWTVFSDKYNGKILNGYEVRCVKHDCTDASDPVVANMIKDFKVDSYPTVILVKGGERYEFDANVKAETLSKFVETVTASQE